MNNENGKLKCRMHAPFFYTEIIGPFMQWMERTSKDLQKLRESSSFLFKFPCARSCSNCVCGCESRLVLDLFAEVCDDSKMQAPDFP